MKDYGTGAITNGLSVEEEKLDATVDQYGDYNEFFQYCLSDDLKAATDKFAECGFNFLKEKITFSRLSLSERIEYAVKRFKYRLNKKSAAIGEFNSAYGEGGTHGGRSLIREAINALFHFYVTNFPHIKKILTSITVDIVKGKKFVMFCDESIKLVSDTVHNLKSDREAWTLLRETSVKFIKEMGKLKKDITEPDPLEFAGLISVYDDNGKLLSADAISKQFNESYCEQLRRRIKDKVIKLGHRYDEEFTELLKKGMSANEAFIDLSKKYNGTLPTKVLTEAEIEKELKSNDPAILKALFEHLV